MADGATLTLTEVRPATPSPPAQPLGAAKAFWTLYTNPVRYWPEVVYRDGIQINKVFGRQFLEVARPDLARSMLLEDADSYGRSSIADRVLRPALGESLLTTDGDQWRRQRRTAAPAFRHTEIATFLPVMRAAGARAGARLAAQGGAVADVTPALTTATIEVVCDTLLETEGFAYDRGAVAGDIGRWLEHMGGADPLDIFGAPEWLPSPWKLGGRAAVRRFRQAAVDIVAAKRRAGAAGATLTDRLIRAADPEGGVGLSDREVVDNVMTFVAAGHETTALALTWTLYLLADAPELQTALVAEAAAAPALSDPAADGPALAAALETLRLHEQVLCEAMRLFPPAAAVGRSVLRETTLGEARLRPGDHVSLIIYALHRRPALWSEPDLFDPSRFAGEVDRFAFLPFSSGQRFCIGMGFAMAEAKAMLAAILAAARIGPGPSRAVEPVLRVTLRPKGGMKLAAGPR